VTVSNFPATQAVSGAVSVSNFPATQPVSGALSVSNFPATQPVSGTVTVSNLPATLGSKLTSAATAVSLATDQMTLPVDVGFAQLLSQPTSLLMNALNAAVQWQVEGGVSYYLTLTNAPAATAQFSGTVSFQFSLDNSSWNAITCTPVATPTTQANSSSTTVGLWLVPAPNGSTVYLRATMTAYVSGSVYAILSPAGQPSATITLPWTYTVTSAQTVMGPLDTSGLAEVNVQISAMTTTVLTAQGSNDPTLTTWDTIPIQDVKVSGIGALTITAASSYRFAPAGYRWMRLQVTTTGTVLTIQGISARLGPPNMISAYGSSTSASIIGTAGVNMAQISGTAALNPAPNGSTNRALVATIGTAVSNVDQSATAYNGAGRINGTIVASATGGGGAVVAAEISVTALTLGTATSVIFVLQESNGGTASLIFSDIWVSDPITTTGIYRMPPILVGGRRRFSAHSVGGTSTTVTTTITTLELPPGYALQRFMRDAYAATNPFALVYNGVALTASSMVLATLNSTTTALLIEGCKALTFFTVLAGAPTVTTQPILTVEFSNDGTNWFTSANTMTAAGNGVYSVNVINAIWRFARLKVTTAAVYSAGAYTISAMGVNGVN
jgi:hypothetical protein